MAFSTSRGRPRINQAATDIGTPELRLKHALGLTAEPIDLCIARALITTEQHWCGLHLRWLYTLRYGAPVLTTRYADKAESPITQDEAQQWRELREMEYHESIALLKQRQRFECVMRVCVFNELPAFLSHTLCKRASSDVALAHQLMQTHRKMVEGLDILVHHWRGNHQAQRKTPITLCDFNKIL